MGFRIATNVQSISAQRTLTQTRQAQGRSIEKLSVGERIVRAGDDAAGLAISEKLKASIRSIKQAGRNANDGISLIQVAEGGINEVQNILIRLRELSMQAATDTVGDVERGFTDKEVKSLVEEVERISNVTRFNDKHLLNGTTGNLDFQVDINNNPEYDRIVYEASRVNTTTDHLGIVGLTVKTKQDAQENLAKVDSAINVLNDGRSGLGGLQSKLQATMRNLSIHEENLAAANSRIRDTDIASETSEMAKQNILATSGTSILVQANVNSTMALRLIEG